MARCYNIEVVQKKLQCRKIKRQLANFMWIELGSTNHELLSLLIVFLRESRQLGLLGLGSGYGCLQLLSYIRVLKLQLLYYRRALQLASLGYGGLGLGLGGAWRSDSQVGANFGPEYGDLSGQEYSDQYQYQT